VVEGVRPDVLIGDKYGYIEDRLFREVFRHGGDLPAPLPLGADPFEKGRYLVEHSGRPVYITVKSRLRELDSHEVVAEGLAFKAVPRAGARDTEKADEEKEEARWEKLRFRPSSLSRAPGDFGETSSAPTTTTRAPATRSASPARTRPSGSSAPPNATDGESRRSTTTSEGLSARRESTRSRSPSSSARSRSIPTTSLP
jgi:hypothetical protein